MKERRGVRWLAVAFVVLTCLMPTGAQGQPSGFLTTTTTTDDRAQETDVAGAIAALQESTTTTMTTGDRSHISGVGHGTAALQGGTTTTTAPPMVMSSEIDPAALAPRDPATREPAQRPFPTPDEDSAAKVTVRDGVAGERAISSVESPIETTTTTAVASHSSIVIADSDQVALPEESGGPVRLSAVGSHAEVFARSMLLLALLLLVAPSVIEARRRKRR